MSEPATTPSAGFRLLALPDELVTSVLTFVALQRYDYSESRRPSPSPLFTLAHSHSRLQQPASALLHRRRSWSGRAKLSQAQHVRFLQVNMLELIKYVPNVRQPQLPRCHTLEMSWSSHRTSANSAVVKAAEKLNRSLPSPDSPDAAEVGLLPNLHTLRLRWFAGPMPTWFAGLSCLTTVSCHIPDSKRLPLLAALPHVTHLELSLHTDAPPLREWCDDGMWRRLRSLSLETPPAQVTRAIKSIEAGLHPLEMLLKGLFVPEHTTITTLSLSVRLQLQVQPVRADFARVVHSLEPLKALDQLVSLTIDDYALATPASVESLAQVWPNLTSATFGSRTVWSGTAAEHATALAGWPKLRTLHCPRWPETAEPWTDSEEVISELAIGVTNLELVGLGGRQSRDEWFRVTCGRGEDGRPERVEPVTLYSIDLDQGR